MDEKKLLVPAWGISVTLHGAVVGLAFVLMAQVKPMLQENVFQWDVALVEATKPDSTTEQREATRAPEQSSARKVVSEAKPVPANAQPVRTVLPKERKVEPSTAVIEPVRPIEQKPAIMEPREEPIERHIVEAATPMAEPIAEAKETQPSVTAALPQPVEARSVHEDSVAASGPLLSTEVAVSQEVPGEESSPSNAEAIPARTSKASSTGPEMKVDHRWLADLLWRRVAELKRYPSTARINGQEGKVIVKAVIRSDGQLADVFVQRSSGHSILDAAAVEAVKSACPLHMIQAIGKPQIVVSLPIVYSLAN